jgi:PncC family amidohydrolase
MVAVKKKIDVVELAKICEMRGLTIGTAESCTGGLLSAWIASEAGVSSFFHGSIISYSRSVKEKILKVPSPLIAALGEVSIPVALEMARGARSALGCSWAVSVTGIAGPSGGTKEKPVGLVCFGVAGPGFELAVQKQFKSAEAAPTARQDIQQQAAFFAFDFLLSAMR